MNWCVAWLDDYLVVHLPKLDFHFNALLWKAHFQAGENKRQSNNLTYCLQRPGLSFTVIIKYLSINYTGKETQHKCQSKSQEKLTTDSLQCAEESNENALCAPKTCDFMFFLFSFLRSFLPFFIFSSPAPSHPPHPPPPRPFLCSRPLPLS